MTFSFLIALIFILGGFGLERLCAQFAEYPRGLFRFIFVGSALLFLAIQIGRPL